MGEKKRYYKIKEAMKWERAGKRRRRGPDSYIYMVFIRSNRNETAKRETSTLFLCKTNWFRPLHTRECMQCILPFYCRYTHWSLARPQIIFEKEKEREKETLYFPSTSLAVSIQLYHNFYFVSKIYVISKLLKCYLKMHRRSCDFMIFIVCV